MDASIVPHQKLCMLIGESSVAFQPDPGTRETKLETLSIDFRTGSVQQLTSATQRGSVPIAAVLGVCHLFKGHAVIVAISATVVANVLGADIYEVTDTMVVTSNEFKSARENRTLLKLLTEGVKPGGVGRSLYFSHFYDVTLSAQRASVVAPDQTPALQTAAYRAEQQFFWNGAMSRPIIAAGAHRFVVPAIFGFVRQLSDLQFKSVDPKQGGSSATSASLTLIARRSIHRAGTRHWRRGADTEGHVANFVETEQLLQVEPSRDEVPTVASFIQIRGSIPLLWTEMPNLKYKPTKQFALDEEQGPAFAKHFNSLKEQYKEVIAINLVNQHGGEGKLAKLFQDNFDLYSRSSSEGAKYIAFDFHKECGTKRYHRMSLLWDQISADFTRYGSFMCSSRGIVSKQLGVVRTNCIDCLDRTNVLQGLLGRKALDATLQSLGLLRKGATLPDTYPEIEKEFKILWADHGDAVSQQYAGTGALKSGFTRTGKRTFGGLLDDGYKSVFRYYLNNFQDGKKQDALDLVTGWFVPEAGAQLPFKRQNSPTIPLVIALSSLSFGLLRAGQVVAGVAQAREGAFDLRVVLEYVVAPVLLGVAFLAIIVKLGKFLVNRPQLCPQLAATVTASNRKKM